MTLPNVLTQNLFFFLLLKREDEKSLRYLRSTRFERSTANEYANLLLWRRTIERGY